MLIVQQKERYGPKLLEKSLCCVAQARVARDCDAYRRVLRLSRDQESVSSRSLAGK